MVPRIRELIWAMQVCSAGGGSFRLHELETTLGRVKPPETPGVKGTNQEAALTSWFMAYLGDRLAKMTQAPPGE